MVVWDFFHQQYGFTPCASRNHSTTIVKFLARAAARTAMLKVASSGMQEALEDPTRLQINQINEEDVQNN